MDSFLLQGELIGSSRPLGGFLRNALLFCCEEEEVVFVVFVVLFLWFLFRAGVSFASSWKILRRCSKCPIVSEQHHQKFLPLLVLQWRRARHHSRPLGRTSGASQGTIQTKKNTKNEQKSPQKNTHKKKKHSSEAFISQLVICIFRCLLNGTVRSQRCVRQCMSYTYSDRNLRRPKKYLI